MARYGDPELSEEARKLFIRRTLKTASHELGHMFSLPHCVDYSCCMQGAMHLEEADEKPVYLCPVCLAKGAYACEYDLVDRFRNLQAFWHQAGFEEEAFAYQGFLRQLSEE